MTFLMLLKNLYKQLSVPLLVIWVLMTLWHLVRKLTEPYLKRSGTLIDYVHFITKLSNVFLNWGFKLLKVELLEILPSPTIQEAMHKQIAAERIRRAAIITADGYREQTKTEAEGECQSMISLSKGEQQVSIITAKGHADAKVLKANAEAEAIRIVAASLREFDVDPTAYLIGLKYIETFTNLALQAQKRIVYFPFEVTNLYIICLIRSTDGCGWCFEGSSRLLTLVHYYINFN